MSGSIEMPKYVCHKEVWALKIQAIVWTEGKIFIQPEDTAYARIEITKDFDRKHNPSSGGYYVVYADGYKSYSPAHAFESGYTRKETA